MKKKNKALLVFCAWGIAAVLAGCGPAAETGNLPQNITMGNSGNQSDTGKENAGNGENQESKAPDQSNDKKEKSAFRFQYEGVTMIPGEVFDQSALGGDYEFSEVPSCAFDGNDRVYTYEKFEVQTYVDGDQERIYSIYFIDPNLPTPEGLCLGDSADDVKSLYGEDYETIGNSYEYKGGNTVLTVITQNDMVVSIEYRLEDGC